MYSNGVWDDLGGNCWVLDLAKMVLAMQSARASAMLSRHMEVDRLMRLASYAAPGDLTIRPIPKSCKMA